MGEGAGRGFDHQKVVKKGESDVCLEKYVY